MNVRITCPINFLAGIHYGDELQMNDYLVKLHILTNSLDGTINNIALDRIKYFIYNEIENTVFINTADKQQCKRYIDAGMNITTIPEAPIDQLIGIMLFNKLNSIAEDKLTIDEIEISSKLGDSIIYYHNQHETVEDLIIPDWWKTADLIHCDADLVDNDIIDILTSMSIWSELNLSWPDSMIDDEIENTVVFADFKLLDETK
jgi:hypothetical protein